MSLQTCCWLAEQLPDNVSCGEGCEAFPRCLPRLALVRKLTERRQVAERASKPKSARLRSGAAALR
jgi:hypothetical protein